MNKKTYNIIFATSTSILTLLGLVSIALCLLTMGKTEDNTDNFMFLFCFVIFSIMTIFETYSIIRSMKTKEENLIKNIVYNQDKQLNKKGLIGINVALFFIIVGFIYNILLFSVQSLPLYSFPIMLKLLVLDFFFLIIIDITFIDLYITIKN